MTQDQHYVTTFDSRVGELTLIATNKGLRAVKWPVERADRLSLPDEMISNPEHPVLVATALQLEQYFEGGRTEFDLPLDLRGTEFQQSAWLALADIPYGETVSYCEQAARIGRPGAVRAIGAANGRNPISIILPCHRVVGANGDLTGFAGGIETKRDLLAFEKNEAHVQGVLELV
jgi:methylated-DNA-[protein]-cysteine S-methyltransferase